MSIYTEFLFWGFLGLMNLVVSILIYNSTKMETKQKIEAEYELSTCVITDTISLPNYFTYITFFTGILNTAGAFLRLRRIHFLEIPTIPWLAGMIRGVDGGDAFMELLEAKWLVAMNDWTSLLMAFTFFMAGFFNFSTVRQLQLRNRFEKKILLPAPRPASYGPTTSEKANTSAGML